METTDLCIHASECFQIILVLFMQVRLHPPTPLPPQQGVAESLADLIIFAADAEVEETLGGLGFQVFHHPAFGDMPKNEHQA
jgi:hypothetical protein